LVEVVGFGIIRGLGGMMEFGGFEFCASAERLIACSLRSATVEVLGGTTGSPSRGYQENLVASNLVLRRSAISLARFARRRDMAEKGGFERSLRDLSFEPYIPSAGLGFESP
jgi:hypothetical protein